MINGWKPTQISLLTTRRKKMASNYKWKKPTPQQEYLKKMRELDKWIKDDMIKSQDIIEANIQKIMEAKNEM
jgi:hypothetical protein